jgi:cellulose synthase/poly-beta-1,6-N-acetylglucosamine synthase-like glycosyltransferase
MQSLDWAYLLGVAAAAVRLKHPLSIIGNNLSFRKKAYASVGGYRTIPFSVTEDYMLFQAIIGSGDWQYEYPVNPGLLVTSKPCETWKELVRQKHRWGKGGLDMRLIGFLMMAVSYLLHGSILIGLAGLSFLSASTAFLIKMCADYLFLYRILIKLQRVELLRYFFSFQLYYSLYVLLLPFLVFFGGKVIWKGREY